MRDSLNHIQGNDLGAGWIDHHTDLLLLFTLLYGMVNLSDLPIVECRRSKPCLNLRMADGGNHVQAPVANRRLCGEVQSRPISYRRNQKLSATMRFSVVV